MMRRSKGSEYGLSAVLKMKLFGLFLKIVTFCVIVIFGIMICFKPMNRNMELDIRVLNRFVPAQISEPKSPKCTSKVRSAYLQDRCQQQGWSKEPINTARVRRNLIVDDRHKLLYCDIPKCGSKSFKDLIGTLAREDFVTGWGVRMGEYLNKTGTRMFYTIPEAEQQLILRDYYKLIVVRHPLDRLRSAWQHKLSEPGKSHALSGIMAMVNDYLLTRDPHRNVTFRASEEFLDFDEFLELVSMKFDQGFHNGHWMTYYSHCQPCHIIYDGIFKLETLGDDMEELYSYLHALNETEHIPRIAHTNNVRSNVKNKLTSVSQIYNNTRRDVINGLMDVYHKDMELFGYTWDRRLGAGCFTEIGGEICC